VKPLARRCQAILQSGGHLLARSAAHSLSVLSAMFRRLIEQR